MRNGILIPDTAEAVVRALCLDYPRRREAIEYHTVTPRTENEFKYYNYKIYDATAEIVGENLANTFINDIGKRIGFTEDRGLFISEVTYKTRKRDAVLNIAYRLHLLDK